jgi:hypothetical protein
MPGYSAETTIYLSRDKATCCLNMQPTSSLENVDLSQQQRTQLAPNQYQPQGDFASQPQAGADAGQPQPQGKSNPVDYAFAARDKVKRFDNNIKSGDIATMKKYLHRMNIVVGFMLMFVTGFFGVFTAATSLSPSGIVISLYSAAFGLGIVLFEMTSSRKVHQFFRENYGFIMTYKGRACFLVLVGLFSMGSEATGAITGSFAILDGLFHVYLLEGNSL